MNILVNLSGSETLKIWPEPEQYPFPLNSTIITGMIFYKALNFN